MELAYMRGKSIDRDGIDVFRGINKQPRIADGEFRDMLNMRGDEYPCITTRGGRAYLRDIAKPNGLCSNGKLAWVDGTSFWFGGTEYANAVEDSPKTMVAMGAQIIIFPDKLRFNTVTEQFDPLEHEVTAEAGVYICNLYGQPYTYATAKPEEPADGAYYLDTEAGALYVFSEALASWQPVPTVYAKIEATGIGAGFKVNDGITVSGIDALNGTHIVRAVGTDYVIVIGILPAAISKAQVTLSRKVPELDFVCEQNNRLWGCRYGMQGDAFVNEIYACALGDPTNWAQFDGTSMDSYRLSLGSAGPFTGIVSHLGSVMAFKEDVIHTVYGNYPANFRAEDTRARGIAAGSAASAAITQETLLYLSPDDVCAIGTGLPGGISDGLAPMEFRGGIGGIYERQYYLACKDRDDQRHLLVYDTDNGVWYREDDLPVEYMAACHGDLYLIADGKLYAESGDLTRYAGSDAAYIPAEAWMLESGTIGLKYPEHKYISQLMIRLEAMDAGTISCEVLYDNDDEWRNVFERDVAKKDNVRISVRPRHCDTMQYRLSGTGRIRLYSIVKHTETAEEW